MVSFIALRYFEVFEEFHMEGDTESRKMMTVSNRVNMCLPPVIWASSGFPPVKNFVKIPTL
jgi:hypothetical protein